MKNLIIVILSFFAIILIPCIIVFIVYKILKKVKDNKKKRCSEKVEGTVISFKLRQCFIIKIKYNVSGKEYIVSETVKMKQEAIKIGGMPIGTKSTPRIGWLNAGDKIDVYYNPTNPSDALIAGNDGFNVA